MIRALKSLLVTGAMGLAIASIAIATVGLSSPAAQASDHSSPSAVPALTARQHRAAQDYAKLPVSFVENHGQTDARVRYLAQGDGYSFFVTPNEVMLSLAKGATAAQPTPRQLALALRFVGSNPTVAPHGSVRAAGVINDLRGSDPSTWHTDIAQYRDVVYPDLWQKIDLRLREHSGVLKYEFHVHPGALPSDIQLAYSGTDGLALSTTGASQITTALGTLADSAPSTYQDIDGVRVPVTSRLALDDHANANGRFSFDVGRYRRDRDLIIDPGVQYTTFLGGTSAETGAVNAAGNAYVTGTTQSPDFPTTTGAFDRTGAASNFSDVFVTKLNPAGTALVYSTFVGGSDLEFGRRLAIDAAGDAYVTGQTKSSNFPTTGGAFDRSLNIPPNCPRCTTDNTDDFVFKLNAAGSALTYSTYLGGTDYDSARGIAVDGSGDAYVTGETPSTDYPTSAGAFDRTHGADYDMFVTKLNPTGSALVYSSFLGGSATDNGERVAVDSAGSAYVSGDTPSANFPTTLGAFDTTNNAGDAFVTKFNPAGSALVYSTFVGGSAYDSFSGVAVDGAGNAWLTGSTGSADFPVTAGAPDPTFNGGNDATIAELNSTGSALPFSTFLGGTQSESGADIGRDANGDVYVTGSTFSQDFPATVGAFDRVWNGDVQVFWGDAFVTKIDIDATTSTPPAPPAVPDAPTLVSPANASTQPQPITFDWNDVASAATSNIQIDDSSTFTAPLVRDQSVTTSTFATSDLSTATQFWRVRGVNSAGVAGAWSSVRSFTPQTAPPPSQLSTTNLNPATVVGGSASSGTVVMTTAASAGAVVSLSSSNPAVASVPATTTVPVNGFTATFVVNTSAVATSTSVTITATYNGVTRTAALTVTPAAAGPTLQSVTVSPASVAGGSNTSGVVTLSAGAPQGGAIVSLSSSNPAVAGVPASVTVGSGTTAAGFTVPTSSVCANTSVTHHRDLRRCQSHRDHDGHRRAPAATADSKRQRDGGGLRAQWRSRRLDAGRHQCDRRQQRNRVVPHGDFRHLAGLERSRRRLVGGLFERRQQDHELHVCRQCHCDGQRQRAVIVVHIATSASRETSAPSRAERRQRGASPARVMRCIFLV